jgi:hypothetical protein
MDEKCELLEKCGFFRSFKANTEVTKNGWVHMYCESKLKSDNCKRKQFRKENGQPPVDNMAPTGKML